MTDIETIRAELLEAVAGESIGIPSQNPLGQDLACIDDIQDDFRTVDDIQCVLQHAHHAVSTTRGTVLDAPDWECIDLLDYVQAGKSASEIALLPDIVATAIRSDPRILSLESSMVRASDSVSISMTGVTANGPFDLVIPISSVSVDYLDSIK